jgi:Membrane bound FAD containing D-sorbitol dehydrogenase
MGEVTSLHDRPPLAERRRLLQGLAALAVSALAPAGWAQNTSTVMSPAAFRSLTVTLTDFAFSDPTLATTLLDALRDAVGDAALMKITTLAVVVAPDQLGAELRAAGLEAQAQKVLVALYTGTIQSTNGTRVLTYDQALAWQAVPWTKPNAQCGGETDYWASAPPNVKS